jgi:uncharacterized protein
LKRFLCALLALLLIFAWTWATAILPIPERPDGWVTDRTGTLSKDQIAQLERKLAEFEKETTNQIVVVLLPSLEGGSLEDFSIRLAEKWKVGQKGKNNGVILLIFKKDRRIRIEVGYGLEGALPDALAGEIIRREIAPRFREGHYYEGIQRGLDAIMAATRGEYRASPRGKDSSSERFSAILFFFFFFFTIVTLSLIALRTQARKRHFYTGRPRGWYYYGGGFFGGGSSWGDSGGGFSGGGGDFGGGGASGDW